MTHDHLLRLYPNGALSFDPAYIGKIKWPNDVYLPAQVNRVLTLFMMELMTRADLQPHSRILGALYSLPGILAFNLSYYRLFQRARQEGLAGFITDEAQPLLSVDAAALSRVHKPDIKDYVAVYGQKFLLALASAAGVVPRLSVSAAGYYPAGIFGRIHRLRRADAVSRVMQRPVSAADRARLALLQQEISDKFAQICRTYDCSLDPRTAAHIDGYIKAVLEKAWRDAEACRRFFGGRRFSYFERSMTPYQNALIAGACRAVGGSVHSTYHGVCQSANEPDMTTMANATCFWAPTDAFARDAHDLSAFIPATLRTYEIKTYHDPHHHKRFVRGDRPRETIRHVAIIGRHVVMRYSAFNMLEFPFYLDLEKKLADFLLAHGYDVTYKAHPESDWRSFDRYFDPRVKIDWRPYEKVMDEFDAVVYHFGASSTLPPALGSHQHLFMIADGWHEQRVWPPRLQAFFREYANMLPGAIGDDGLIKWDENIILELFKSPKPVNPEQRIFDFFNKIY